MGFVAVICAKNDHFGPTHFDRFLIKKLGFGRFYGKFGDFFGQKSRINSRFLADFFFEKIEGKARGADFRDPDPLPAGFRDRIMREVNF